MMARVRAWQVARLMISSKNSGRLSKASILPDVHLQLLSVKLKYLYSEVMMARIDLAPSKYLIQILKIGLFLLSKSPFHCPMLLQLHTVTTFIFLVEDGVKDSIKKYFSLIFKLINSSSSKE